MGLLDNALKKIPELADAIKNTAGALLRDDGLTLRVLRRQSPEQAGEESIRSGVFFLPEGATTKKHYTGTRGYGGSMTSTGETTYKNPIVMKGATGGKVPERAYDEIKGKGAYKKMRREVLDKSWGEDSYNRKPNVVNIKLLLMKYGGNPDMAEEIIRHSSHGNTLPYAIQEHIVANTIRDNGYDAVIGVGKQKGQPILTEIFDVRAGRYPSKEEWNFNFPDFYKQTGKKIPDSTVYALPIVAGASLLSPPHSYADQWKNYKNTEPALQEPLIDPTTLLAGPARWGGGLMNMGIDSALKYITGNRQ